MNLAQAVADYGFTGRSLAERTGFGEASVRRWIDGARPRPQYALGVARQFPIEVGKQLLTGWGYSPKGLDVPPQQTGERGVNDDLRAIVSELRMIRRFLYTRAAIEDNRRGEELDV